MRTASSLNTTRSVLCLRSSSSGASEIRNSPAMRFMGRRNCRVKQASRLKASVGTGHLPLLHLVAPHGEAGYLAAFVDAQARLGAGLADALIEHVGLRRVPADRRLESELHAHPGQGQRADAAEEDVLGVVHP